MFEKIEMEFNKYNGLRYLLHEIYKYKTSLDDLYKYGMVLLGVDSFRQGIAMSILEFFIQNGFILIDFRVKHLNRTQTENLFLPTSSCIKCEDLKWWMIQDAANQGIFCCAMFYHKNSTVDKNCLIQLNSFKGRSNPLNNAEGVVRYNFAAINVCLNLIHIPDTYGDFFKDTSPFYKIEEISKLIQKAPTSLGNDELFQISLYEERVEVYCFEPTLYKVKLFLSYLLKNEINANKLTEYYEIQYKTFRKIKQREERYHIFKNSIDSELKMLMEIMQNCINKIKNENELQLFECLLNNYNVLRLLRIFTEPQLYRTYENDIFGELKNYGIFIDDFEKLILNTSLIQHKS